MDMKLAAKAAPPRQAAQWLSVAAVVLLAACSSEKTADSTRPAVASAGNDAATTAAVSVATGVDNKLEFFTERYLASEERLKRRQDRIEQALTTQQ